MANRKTSAERAATFFDRSILRKKFSLCMHTPTQFDFNRLDQFWSEWLTVNKVEPNDALYITVYTLIVHHPTITDLYSKYTEVRSAAPNSKEHLIALYGVEVGLQRYTAIADTRSVTMSYSMDEKIKALWERKPACELLKDYECTPPIIGELTTLFTIQPYSKFGDDFALIADFVRYPSPNFADRYKQCKEYSHTQKEYYQARYGSSWKSKFDATKARNQFSAQNNFPNLIEYWVQQGLDEESCARQISEVQTSRAKWAATTQQGLPRSRTVEFWVNKGLDLTEAHQRVREIQSRDLDFFIRSHGEDDGLVRFNRMITQRIDKWWSKPEDERTRIGKARGRTFEQVCKERGAEAAKELFASRYSYNRGSSTSSRSANDFFRELDEKLLPEQAALSVTGYKGPERWVQTGPNFYFLDYINSNCVIEFYGSFWHADPRLFAANDHHCILNTSAETKWKRDATRIENIKKLGYDVLIIWSKDVDSNRSAQLQLCLDFINNK